MRRVFPAVIVLALATACGGGAGPGEIGVGSSDPVAADAVARYEDAPRVDTPDEWYRDEPVYVGNEMPVEEVHDR